MIMLRYFRFHCILHSIRELVWLEHGFSTGALGPWGASVRFWGATSNPLLMALFLLNAVCCKRTARYGC